MKIRRFLLTSWVLCCVLLCSAPGFASGAVTLNFFVPEHLDPNNVVTFLNTNPRNVNGADLTVNNPLFPNVKGIEIHSAIPGAMSGTIQDINSLEISFNYDGNVVALSTGAITDSTTYAPWIVTGGLDDPATSHYAFLFTKDAKSAPVNNSFVPGPNFPNNQSFATATITGDDADLLAFDQLNARLNVRITPGVSTVPEPGALALFTALGVTGGLFAVRRLRGRRIG